MLDKSSDDTPKIVENLKKAYTGSALNGFAVLPINEDKKPVVPWKTYQSQIPSAEKIHAWFTNTDHQTAIITGRINRIIVLDLDTPQKLVEFFGKHFELAQTLNVKTKRGYHLYYAIPDDLYVPSCAGDNVDLKAEGGYVVAPGSTINEHTYTIQSRADILSVDEQSVLKLIRFVRSSKSQKVRRETIAQTQERQKQEIKEQQQESIAEKPEEIKRTITIGELRGLFRALAENGRNNALFEVACKARDHGWTQNEVVGIILDDFIQAEGKGQGKRESARQRKREGLATIKSAFSRPPRPLDDRCKGLPNLTREKLLADNHVAFLRVIEGLYLKGYQPNDIVTRPEILAALDGIVGRNSVDKALNTVFHSKKAAFSVYTPHANAAVLTDSERSKKCFLDGVKKRGQLERVVVIPSPNAITEALGVAHSQIRDDLTLADLSSPKALRTRLHKAFLQRRSSHYSVRFLAQRLGVTRRTVQSYNAEDPTIRAQVRIAQTPLYAGNLSQVLPKGDDWKPHPGVWLEDRKRNRYPAVQEIAAKLFKQGKKHLSLMRQLTNWWYVVSEQPSQPEQAEKDQKTEKASPALEKALENMASKLRLVEPKIILCHVEPDDKSSPKKKPPKRGKSMKLKKKRGRPITGKRKMKDPFDEEVAQEIKARVNAMTENPNHKVSLRSARLMVHKYGRDKVERTVSYIENRDNPVRKPIGLLATILRSDAREG